MDEDVIFRNLFGNNNLEEKFMNNETLDLTGKATVEDGNLIIHTDSIVGETKTLVIENSEVNAENNTLIIKSGSYEIKDDKLIITGIKFI